MVDLATRPYIITTPFAAFKRRDRLKTRKNPAPSLMTRAEAPSPGFCSTVVGGRWLSFPVSPEPFPWCCCSRHRRHRLLCGNMVCFRLSPVPGSGLVLLCLVLGELLGPPAQSLRLGPGRPVQRPQLARLVLGGGVWEAERLTLGGGACPGVGSSDLEKA